ncbi:hypothetical protein DSM21852_07550 [Methylocystis bryophila]|nr:hypothetical protein DSM21852_07550 [Methylocystis bryophila]
MIPYRSKDSIRAGNAPGEFWQGIRTDPKQKRRSTSLRGLVRRDQIRKPLLMLLPDNKQSVAENLRIAARWTRGASSGLQLATIRGVTAVPDSFTAFRSRESVLSAVTTCHWIWYILT